jgi:hypothetical protein
MAPRRAAALAGALVLALALSHAPQPARAQTASSWLQVFNMLLKPRACSGNGKVLAVCRRDPCAVTSCPTGFRCKADYCGACSGICEADAEAPEDEKAAQARAPMCEVTGQKGVMAVRPQCSTPMCTYMQCGKEQACVNDFCGGCTGTCVNSTETLSEFFCLLCSGVRAPEGNEIAKRVGKKRRRRRCCCFFLAVLFSSRGVMRVQSLLLPRNSKRPR